MARPGRVYLDEDQKGGDQAESDRENEQPLRGKEGAAEAVDPAHDIGNTPFLLAECE